MRLLVSVFEADEVAYNGGCSIGRVDWSREPAIKSVRGLAALFESLKTIVSHHIGSARWEGTHMITSFPFPLPLALADEVSSSENRNSISEMFSPSLAITSVTCCKPLPDPFLRLFFAGVSDLSTRKALEIETAQSGTPIGFLSVDIATCLGSCSTSLSAIELL